MVRRLTDEPLLTRGVAAETSRPGHIGRVEPVVGPPPRGRRGPDWGLVLITAAFLGGAAGLVYFGYMSRKGESLAAGETRIIAGRPDTVIPDSGQGGAPILTPTGSTKPGSTAGAPPPAAADGSGYSLSSPAQGGDVGTRPSAHSAPEPQGTSKPRPTSSAPGVLQAPSGMKPVK
ncbi:hypothetical protein [Zavarzinia aquatilis]|uniref:Uncharacterized protein n=1 Tax=Zavarzinia aquatilis TaxID=2211142 RepID=A0A317E7V5_9PROT|nr:hypothetical protein [Zavarzinia aquatilis]PWR22741.1 hypothetical protein DKG74_09900 [Zavarzinia aquatilis]